LEIEIHLKEKPTTNRFGFTIQTKGLNFYYQPALTKEEIKEGASQPENVIGSYAVYHATKRDNRVGGKEYKTGKFCHIYRPHITDADGNETWGELELDEEAGVLTVVVPQAFLNRASYPVIVDPTFGYDTAGGTLAGGSSFTGERAFLQEFTLNENGEVTEISASMGGSISSTPTIIAALYTETATDSLTLEDGERKNESVANPQGWKSFDVSATLTAGEYFLGASISPNTSMNTNVGIFYDSASSKRGVLINGGTLLQDGSGIQSTRDISAVGTSFTDRNYSIYATYEATASENTKIKISGTFEPVTTNIKLSGTFVEKTMKVKVGGTFV
jgi:hypothetical protein